jgi:hypothetical protein
MPKRKKNKLTVLGFHVLSRHGVPDTYKCSCGDMEKYVEYQTALNHSYKCDLCKEMQARLQDQGQMDDAGEQCLF